MKESGGFTIGGYFRSLLDPEMSGTAMKVALVVGSILLTINHGKAIVGGTMTLDRWFSAILTYCVPYMVNIHGQYSSRVRRR